MSIQTEPMPQPIAGFRDGERMSRDEFERRYEAMPNIKAELIDGVVYTLSSPVSHQHANPHFNFVSWLGSYAFATPGTEGSDNGTVRLSDDCEVQPDAFLRILESCGGQSHVDNNCYVTGAPELIGEIAYSSVNYDRNTKRPIYERDGVREFILWRVEDGLVEWFILRGGAYQSLTPDADGIIRSEAFPGLWLDTAALVRRDMVAVSRTLQAGIVSAEHARFVEDLSRRARQK